MGNQLQGCCTDTKDTTNEISGIKKEDEEEDNIGRAKGGNTRSVAAAPFIEQQSQEIFENREINNQANNTPQGYDNVNGNFNSENLNNFQKAEFKPDEALISNFLISPSQKADVNLDEFLSENVQKAKSSTKISEIYTPDYASALNQPEFKGDNIVELPPVYTDKEKKSEIYKGSWIIDKEIQEGEVSNLNSNMKFHGFGTYIKKDCSVQEGIFRYGELDGPGKTYVNNGDTFTGNYEKGMLNDKGVFVDFAGDVYEGEFKANIMEGQGKETFIDGSAFEGEYKDNKKNGEGTFVWSDNSFYQGELKDNHFHGHGVYEWASGLKYDGKWEKGLMEGEGIITTKNGDYYEGEFKNNKKDGLGLFWWSEKKYYLGYWKQGVQHGDGKFFKEGKVMIGSWMNGKFKNHKKNEEIRLPERKFNKEITFQLSA